MAKARAGRKRAQTLLAAPVLNAAAGLWRAVEGIDYGALVFSADDSGRQPQEIVVAVNAAWRAFFEARGKAVAPLLEEWARGSGLGGLLVLCSPRGIAFGPESERLEQEVESLLVRWFINEERYLVGGDEDLKGADFLFQIRPWAASAALGMTVRWLLPVGGKDCQTSAVGQHSEQILLGKLNDELVARYIEGLPPERRQALSDRLQGEQPPDLSAASLPALSAPKAAMNRIRSLVGDMERAARSRLEPLQAALDGLRDYKFENPDELQGLVADLQTLARGGLQFSLAEDVGRLKGNTPVYLTFESPHASYPAGRMVATDSAEPGRSGRRTRFFPLQVKPSS